MSIKIWKIKEHYSPEFSQNLPGFHPVVLQLLYNRGLLTHKQIDEFLNPDYTQDIHNPFLFRDMKKATERIMRAINNNEKILIYGDYDADGVTAAVLLEKTLRRLGAENLDVFIPHREIDGYGLSLDKIENIIQEKFNLVITVDCGITNTKPIKKLKDAGIETVIADHHLETGELPEAYAILNCSIDAESYPFKKLSGVGMAFKLAQGLFQENKKTHRLSLGQAKNQARPASRSGAGENKKLEDNPFEPFEKWLLDLVVIGTIGDVSPIVGENRTLVKYGLLVLNKTPRKGLQELIKVSRLSNGKELENLPLGAELYDLDVYNIAYQIVPRINAVGRIDHANLAYKLLTTEDEIEAIALARDIHEKNSKRQQITDQILIEAHEIFGQVINDKKILIAASEKWPLGVVGLVAGKLKDEFSRPVILFAKDKEKYSGSGRSITELNITQTLAECGEYLERFGGHSQACGLSILGQKNYEKFLEKINYVAQEKLKDVKLYPTIEIEGELKLLDLNWELVDELEKFEPFAEANPKPLFLIKNLKIESLEVVGKNQDHLRLLISQGNEKRKAISFGTARDWQKELTYGDKIDIVTEVGINEWNGNRELQLKIIDFKKSNHR